MTYFTKSNVLGIKKEGCIVEILADDLDKAIADFECGKFGGGDEINAAIVEVIEHLVRCDYSDEVAHEAVFDAMSVLVESGKLEDTPKINSLLEQKNSWISQWKALIYPQLECMGIELSEDE